ncbi:MAG: hypothetical protein M1827_004392 [Pycnora praestabilis]|nr:MAG: hypothetical protein M1827_004392 [Pycnora praestabilis]
MSYSGYQQYGGNPYAQEEPGYSAQNGALPPATHLEPPAPLNHELSNYSQGSTYSAPAPTSITQGDFLARVENARQWINHLTSNVTQIGTYHQAALSNPDSTSSAQLEHTVSQTQILNTQIKDQIKFLEADAQKTPADAPEKKIKVTQVGKLKRDFEEQLKGYQREEQDYRQRYREQIARQYRIVNPEATEAEVDEARNADWGNEGVFQTALKSNRTGAANSVLGAVRARHNEIQRIEQTLAELGQLFQDMATLVETQEPVVERIDDRGQHTVEQMEAGNKQIDVGIKHAKTRNKLKWWTLLVVVLIVCILALVLGLVFGLRNK